MRYYDIIIRNKDTGDIIRPASLAKLNLESTYTSYINGKSIAGALNIVLDVPLAPFAIPTSNAYVSIQGVSLAEISQSNDLSGHEITIFAGMRAGLPLAKPEQSQLPLVQGSIFQAFGNWEGTNQSLDLMLQAFTGTLREPKNLTLNWKKNTTLGDAIRKSLSVAFGSAYSYNISISNQLKKSSDEIGFYATLAQFARDVKDLSLNTQFKGITPVGGGAYQGVEITLNNKTFNVTDGTVVQPARAIAFEDLIGQPTWIGPNTLNFKTAIRTDISVGDRITMPAINTPFVLTAPGAAFSGVPARSQSTFKGEFQITEAHAFGNFRMANATAWVMSFNASSVPYQNSSIGSASP